MRDAPPDSVTESTYECYACGIVIEEEINPGSCPKCGCDLRNRTMPME